MVSQTLLFLIVAGVAGLLIGFLLGNLIGGRGNKSSKTSSEAEEIKKEGYAEIARLWYSPATKKIVSEMDEGFFHEFSGLTPEQQKKALRLSDLFSNWVKTSPVVEEKTEVLAEEKIDLKVPEPTPPKVEEPNPIDSLREETLTQVARPARPGSTKPLPFVDSEPVMNIPQPAEPAAVEPAPVVQMQAAEPKPEDAEKPKSRSISAQINEVIDDLIKSTTLRDKGLRLVDRPDHGIDVVFAGEKYSGIDAVPYPEVRSLIKAAVTRWEKETAARARIPQ
jgi:hypothetical protein